MENKWYQKSLGIVTLLILFFPAGLFLMWKYARWNNLIKATITGLFVLLVIGGATSSNSSKPEQVAPTPTKQAQQTPQSFFDVPSLVGKDLNGVTAVLGNPQGIDVTDEQIKLGTKKWDKTFVKNGKELLVTYNISDGKVIDFFISTDDPSGFAQDKKHLLELGNLQENDPKYKIEFVKALKRPTTFTGIKVIPL